MKTTIQKINNQIIITLPKEDSADCCSICSRTSSKYNKITDITNGTVAILLAKKINKHNFCQGCKTSIHSITSYIENKIIDERLSFHTVELSTYYHSSERTNFDMNRFRYLKPNAVSTLKVLNNNHIRNFQLDQDPYTLEEYKDWNKTVKIYDLWNEREYEVYENNKEHIIKEALKEYPQVLEDAEVQFFLRLSRRIK